jgi:hypothetical protein
MFEPKFLIEFTPIHDGATCLGSQLITIVEFLKTELKTHAWYAADVDAFSDLPSERGVNTWKLGKIGNDECLIEFCKEIHQFIWGVFIAVDSEWAGQDTSQLEIATESDLFRPIDLDGVLVEIRTFDTSYFQIYSEDEHLMNRLARKFGAEIESNTAP